MLDLSIFWQESISQLLSESVITTQEYSMWFKNMKYESSGENAIILSVPSPFYRDQVIQRYEKILTEKLLELSGSPIKLEFIIENRKTSDSEDDKPAPPPVFQITEKESEESEKPVKPHSQLNDSYTFETFVVGNNNLLAANAAKAIAGQPGIAYNPCLIYGGVGLGKTHLMQAIGYDIYQKNTKLKVAYITAETFLHEFIMAIRNSKQGEFKKKYRNADVLLIDDIHDLQNKTDTQEELFYTFNALYDSNKQMVFTCDRPVSELKNFTARLRNRFERGLNVDLQPPGVETRMAILKKKMEAKNVSIPR